MRGIPVTAEGRILAEMLPKGLALTGAYCLTLPLSQGRGLKPIVSVEAYQGHSVLDKI